MPSLYHQQLQLPVPFTVDELGSTSRISQYPGQHPELITFLLQQGVRIRDVQRFYTPPDGVLLPHVDCDHVNNYTKLNYVFGGAGSKMNWFQLKPGAKSIALGTEVGTRYLAAIPRDLEPVHSASIGFPSLINSGQFHSITNGPDARICYSFMLCYANDPEKNLDWADAMVMFKDWFQTT
jgi:hypothetical protein